jgi:hypothetical protein
VTTEDVIINASKTTAMVVTFDVADLVVTMFEGLMDLKQPHGQTREEGRAMIEETDPALYESLLRASHHVMEYLKGRFESATPERMQ